MKRSTQYLKSVFFLLICTGFFSFNISAQTIPPFKMKLSNGTVFSASNLVKNKPVIIIYFAPDCEHCQVLMKQLFKKINEFKSAQIVMVTFKPLNEVKQFEKDYNTAAYKNIKVGIESPIFYFRYYFKLENTPFTALYDKTGKLIYSWQKEAPINDLLGRLKKLK
jgi:thioredoxin-related protein